MRRISIRWTLEFNDRFTEKGLTGDCDPDIPQFRVVVAPVLASIVQQQLHDDTCRNCHQNIVAAGLNPVVAARWSTQIVAAPIIDDIVIGSVLGWHALASIVRVIRAGASPLMSGIVVARSRVLTPVGLACIIVGLACVVVRATLLIAALTLPITIAVDWIAVALGKGDLSSG